MKITTVRKRKDEYFVTLKTTDAKEAERWKQHLGQTVDPPAVRNCTVDECEVKVESEKFKTYVALHRPWPVKLRGSSKSQEMHIPVVTVTFRSRTHVEAEALAKYLHARRYAILTSDRKRFIDQVLDAAKTHGFTDTENVTVRAA